MRRKTVFLIVTVGILASLLLARRFFGSRISDRGLLVEALQEHEKANQSSERFVFWDVFCQQAAQGYYDDAMATILRSNRDSDVQYSLIALARIRATNGDVEGALRTARAYSVSDTREKAIQAIAVAQAERGDVQGARRTISLLTDPRSALEAIAVVQVDNGDIQGAHETIAGLPAANRALDAIGEYQIKSGDFQAALKTAEQMSSNSTANLLLDIGFELRRRGEQGRVHQLASQITNRELAHLFVYYARLAQSTMENIPTVRANTCDEASFDASKGDFAAAYGLIKQTKCWYSLVATRQYATDPGEAERELLLSPSSEDICFGLTEFAKAGAARGNTADALRFINAAQNVCGEKYGYRLGAVREVARLWTIKDGPKPVVAWARSRPNASQRAGALLGVAEAMGHSHP